MTIVRVGVEWINNFPPSGQACSQNDLSWCNAQAEGFATHMGNHGHTQVFDWGDSNAWETDFRNPDFGGGGDSLNWSDNVHFCFFDDHGGNWNGIMHIAFASQHNQCMGSSDTWRLGAGMMKWFVLAGCQGVLGTDTPSVIGVWGAPMQGVHLVLAFIGDSMDTWWTASMGSDFADDVCNGKAICGTWLDHAYNWWTGDKAIAIASGETQDDAINRRENETLDWRDWSVSINAWMAWKWRE
ncbi:MAG TPA: DUF6345 domain-containing protein [Thermoplasmata archaeon]|nr:DUF6345 domain-containing protein [Thermoplasmata archaeon]